MDNIIRIEIINYILKTYFQKTSSIKLRIKDLLKELKESNPIFFKKIKNIDLKKEIIRIYPIYKNKKKRTKWFKVTRSKSLEYIKKHNINIRGL